MPAKSKLLGRRFGHLSVVAEEFAPAGSAWLCRCDCGKSVVRLGKDLLRTQRRGWIDSCGCQTQLARSIASQFKFDDHHLQAMHQQRSTARVQRKQRHGTLR